MKYAIIFFALISNLLFAQKKDYEFVTEDKEGAKWYFSFTEKTELGFKGWLKEVRLKHIDPPVKHTEFLTIFDCEKFAISDEEVIITFYNGKILSDKSKQPFQIISERHFTRTIFEKYCKKE